jgi:hypothetical protein
MLAASAFAWAAGAIAAVRRAVDGDGVIAWQRALPGALIAGAGVAAWLLAIWRA